MTVEIDIELFLSPLIPLVFDIKWCSSANGLQILTFWFYLMLHLLNDLSVNRLVCLWSLKHVDSVGKLFFLISAKVKVENNMFKKKALFKKCKSVKEYIKTAQSLWHWHAGDCMKLWKSVEKCHVKCQDAPVHVFQTNVRVIVLWI